MGVAVSGNEVVEKFEQPTGDAEPAKGFDHPATTDGGIEQVRQCGASAGLGARGKTGVGYVIEALAGPFERGNHVLLVEPRPLIEISLLALDEPSQLDWQHQ